MTNEVQMIHKNKNACRIAKGLFGFPSNMGKFHVFRNPIIKGPRDPIHPMKNNIQDKDIAFIDEGTISMGI